MSWGGGLGGHLLYKTAAHLSHSAAGKVKKPRSDLGKEQGYCTTTQATG